MVKIYCNVIFLPKSYFIWGNSVTGFIWFWSVFGELMFCFLLYFSCLPTYSSLSIKIWDHSVKMRVSICNPVWFCYFPVLWCTSWSDKSVLSCSERKIILSYTTAYLKVWGVFFRLLGFEFCLFQIICWVSQELYVSQSVNAGGYLRFPFNSLMHTEEQRPQLRHALSLNPFFICW